MGNAVVRFIKGTRGATAIEYGVIAAGVALAIAGGVALMGGTVGGVFGTLSDFVTRDDTSTGPGDRTDPAPPPAEQPPTGNTGDVQR